MVHLRMLHKIFVSFIHKSNKNFTQVEPHLEKGEVMIIELTVERGELGVRVEREQRGLYD